MATKALDSSRATKNQDGTWTIQDVPVFATHKDWRDGRVVDEAWLRSALERAVSRYKTDGYLPPIHVHHHGDEGVRFAGKFQLKGVEQVSYEGRPRPFLLADLTVTPEVFEEIKAGRLPFVSVEIQRPSGPPEIDSLALLDHDPPFFRKPLRVEADEVVKSHRAGAEQRPALAYRSAKRGSVAVLYPFRLYGGVAMADETKTDAEKKPEEKKGDDSKAYMSDELDAVKTATKEALEAFKGKLEALCTGLEGMAKDLGLDLGAAPEAEAATDAGPAELPMAAMKSAKEDSVKNESPVSYAAVLGRLAALEADRAADKKASAAAALAEKTLGELAEYGIGAESRATLLELARTGGEVACKAYASAVKASRLREPPPEWTGDLPTERERKDSDAVAAYASRGADALKLARRLDAKYFAARKRHAPASWLAAQSELGPIEGGDVYGGRLNGAAKE